IGAGIGGLTLAQSLNLHSIPYTIYERESSASVRKQGWGLTIQWSLEAMAKHFLPETFDRLCQAQISRETGLDGTRRVPWVNGSSGVVEGRRPASQKFRFRRSGIREALIEGVDVQWDKQLVDARRTKDGVQVEFSDGTTATGDILIGADGAMSAVRKVLAPTTYPAQNLPINAIATGVPVTEEQYKEIRDTIDPLYFLATHPETNTCLFWSLQDTPEEGATYTAQMFLSWLKSDEDNAHDEELLKKSRREVFMKRGKSFFGPLGEIAATLPEDAQVAVVSMMDWPYVEWDTWDGQCTLIGDAAHCMTPFRGEGVNHAIVDACYLADNLKLALDGQISVKDAIEQYEAEMRPRGLKAVQNSRQAGFEAHSYTTLAKGGSSAFLEVK
ncbi:FAD-dependent oxidoreductase, partial [Aspergillus ruber CBS 135680]